MTLGGTTSGTNAGSYNATFMPTANYQWSDKSTAAKTVSWTIGRMNVSLPTQNGTLTFNGKAQSPVWKDYSAAQLTLGGVTSGTNAGSYSATFTPTGNYQWSDGSTTAKTATWTIGRLALTAVPAQSGTLTYNGKAQSPTWSNYDAAKLTLGGEKSGTNAKSYSATFTPTGNYKWSDGSTAAKSVSWSIGRAAVSTVPSQSGSLTYSGSAQSPTWSNHNTAQLTLGGTTSGTNAGTYSATFTPTANYKWSDGTTTAKTVNWTIGRKDVAVPSQSGTLTYSGSEQSPAWSNYHYNERFKLAAIQRTILSF